MARTAFFSPPDGDVLENPDVNFLRILFLYIGEEYWNAGAGSSYLDYDDGKISSRLEIFYSKGHGFYLHYQAHKTDFHSTDNKKTGNEITTIYTGGNPLVLPSYLFIGREVAFTVIEAFCKDGTRSDTVDWTSDDELTWDWEKYLT